MAMKKLFATVAALVFVFALSSRASASSRVFTLPPQAREIAPNVYDLGVSTDNTGRKVQGLAIIHPKPYVGHHHRDGHTGGPGGGGGSSKCYAFIANGARWRTTEDYLVNPENSAGLDHQAVRDNLKVAMNAWDNEVAFQIFGVESAGVVDGLDTSSTDGKNEIMFGDISDSGAIAVTIVWYTVGGPPWARQIVEHDQMYDDADFGWSVGDPVGSESMDFLNIATHEIGHSAGMGHPEDSCTGETMFRFATEGETKKRDLHTGDTAGVADLYN